MPERKHTPLSHAELQRVLSYSPDVGVWRRRVPCGGNKVGDVAGRVDPDGRTRIKINGRTYSAYRLAWFYMTGEWPPNQVDHKDGDPSNDRWDNLRLATQSQNKCNGPRQRNNKSGYKGVSFKMDMGKWRAAIKANGKYHHLGYFCSPSLAHLKYRLAAVKYHGEFRRAV